MKKSIGLFVLSLGAIFLLMSCAGVISFKNPKLTGGKIEQPTPVAKKPPILFDDFETGALIGGFGFANTAGGASVKYLISDQNPHGGKYCARAIYDTGTNSDWGCGFAVSTPYGPGYIDASGRTSVSVWVNCPEGLGFIMMISEASANGADGEHWRSASQTGTGKWSEYVIDFQDFAKDIYSGNQNGNNILDLSAIATVGFQIDGANGKGDFYVDDIWFK